MLVIPSLILKKGPMIFLTKRSASRPIWPAHWHCVMGGIEKGESPQEAIIREAEEEIGITITNTSLECVLFEDYKDVAHPRNTFYGLRLFFVADLEDGQEPVNKEPLKQDAMGWFSLDALPEPMIPTIAFGLKAYFNKECYAEFHQK